MNAKTLISSIALTLAGVSSHAFEATQFVTEASTLSRAEVLAELARANAAGELDNPGETYGSVAVARLGHGASAAPRARVVAEVRQALSQGELVTASDSYGSFRAIDLASTLTRAEVRAQLRQGGLSRGNYSNYTGG